MDSYLLKREMYGGVQRNHRLSTRGFMRELEKTLISRLGVTATLQGHSGCVNSLRFSSDGRLLLSGSDDHMACIWDDSGELKHVVKTEHEGNIFGVEFLPYGEDRVVATCAADHMVKAHDIVKGEEIYSYGADDRVKRLATAQDEPYLFWSACEDGYIRQHDVRTNTAEKIISDVGNRITKTLSVCQGRTELMAVGLNIFYVSVFDRRMVRGEHPEPMMRCAPTDFLGLPDPMHHSYTYSTHVAFDYSGRELIVNQNGGIYGGTVFVYNLTESSNPVPTMQKLQAILDETQEIIATEYPSQTDVGLDETVAKMKNEAKEKMEEGPSRDLPGAIRIYSECLGGNYQISNSQRSLIYANRGLARLLCNKPGDLYSSVRDSIEAIRLNPGYRKAYFRLMKTLILMKQLKLARDVFTVFRHRFNGSPDLNILEKQLIKQEKLPENSQYYDLRHPFIPMVDYESRYTGHKNMHTDIKEANFFGTDNQYIVSGSDCGKIVVWSRQTGLVIEVFQGDDEILNIIQPHPDKFLLATSGIEHCIRFWEPLPEEQEEPRRRSIDELSSGPTNLHYFIMRALVDDIERRVRHDGG